jgi:pantothenate synthetase
MKELLNQLIERLEQQTLKQITMDARLTALEVSFDSLPDVGEIHSGHLRESEQAADRTREVTLSLYASIRQLIAKLPD